MNLQPREVDHLLLHQVGFVAQKRLARGVRLNAVETQVAPVLLCERRPASRWRTALTWSAWIGPHCDRRA
jgi:hypothetical protein